MKKVVLSISFILFAFLSFSQKTDDRRTERDAKKEARRQKIDNLIRQQEEGALIFNKQNVFGLRLNTDGWGVLYEKGYLKTATTANLFAIEFNEKKHPKEKKLNNVLNNNGFLQLGNPYVYGKRNSFYQIKLSYGQQRMLGAKANKNGVAIHAIYGGGFSAGLNARTMFVCRIRPVLMVPEILNIQLPIVPLFSSKTILLWVLVCVMAGRI